MMCRGLIAASVVVMGSLGEPPQQLPAARDAVYVDFMRLTIEQRGNRFIELSPENKSLIVRTHAERWLAANRARLSGSEVEVFEEIIAFITPERYGQSAKGAIHREEQALRAKMTCRVSSDDVMQAFDVTGAGSKMRHPKRWTYLDAAKCWLLLVAEELVDYLPRVRR